MARSTSDPKIEVPKGMMKFEVIRSTIKDSLGQYCCPGDMAVLTKKQAQAYLDKNFIKVVLPEFEDDEDDTADTADSAPDDKEGQDTDTPEKEGEDSGGDDGDNSAERSEATANPRKRGKKGS